MKKKKIILTGAAVAAVVVIGIGAWTLFGRKSSDGSTENVVYVNSVDNLMNPGSGNGAVNRFAGVVETQKQVDIQQSQDKTVKDIYVEVGQEVSKGDPLFSYDTEKSQEDLEKAKLELERIDNNIGNKQNEIAALEKEKKSAGNDAQLDYTMQIQSAQMELKQSEYEKKSKQVEIQKLQDSIENCQVTSEIDGVVKSINNGNQDSNSYSGDSQAFMSIIAMGDFRIKCKVNEQNIASVTPGQAVIVHSRVDDSVTWKGTMGAVDKENPGNGSNNGYYFSSGDGSTQSNSYPFYIELDSSEGLMLGQHVYVEADYGQSEEKAGIWLDESFICDADTDSPYVWVDDGKGKLEKGSVTLGQHDDELFQYEIADGLSKDDMITYPEEGLKEGMKTAVGSNGQMGQSNPVTDGEDMDFSNEDYSEEENSGSDLSDENMDGVDSGGCTVILELKDICKDYIQGKMVIPVLKHIDFQMEKGEYVAIMGPSGSGKTTLMNIVGCLDQATSGQLFLDGQDISKCTENEMSDLRLKKIGFVFQNFQLLSRQTALENVELPLTYAGVAKKERRERALQALTRVGLEDRVNFQPNQLSGGQKQRVAIARALVNRPKILLADEPTGALDSTSGEQVMELFQSLNDEGVSVLMITHDSEIAAKAQRKVIIRDGIMKKEEQP